MARVKVVAKFPRWSRLIWLGLVGVAIELVYHWLVHRHFELANYMINAAIVLLPIVLSFTEQRIGRAIAESAVIGGTLAATNGIISSIAIGRAAPIYEVVLGIVGGSALIAGGRIVAVWVVRTFVRKLVLQNGALCWKCAYDLTGNTSGRCPECGEVSPRAV